MTKNTPIAEYDELLKTLQNRFEENMERHQGINWSDVETKLNEILKN